MKARTAWVTGCQTMAELVATPCPVTLTEQLDALAPSLRKLRQSGVDAVLIPIHWRRIAPLAPEQIKQEASWQGVKALCQRLQKHGFKLQFQLQFGAAFDEQALPDWFWGHIKQKTPPEAGLGSSKLIDQRGVDTSTVPGVWCRSQMVELFGGWMQAFVEQLAEFAPASQTMLLGLGERGEACLPYKSEQFRLFCFAPAALASLEAAMLEKYQQRQDWHAAWQLEPEENWQASLQRRVMTLDANGEQPRWLSDVASWYCVQWQAYIAEMLTTANKVFNGPWQESKLALLLPSIEKMHGGQALQNVMSGLNPHYAEGHELQVAYQAQQLESWQQASSQRMQVIINGLESSQVLRAKPLLLAAVSQLKLDCLAQNSRPQSLANHPAWDQLYHAVIQHQEFSGWVFNDLAQLGQQAVVKSRLQQLNKFKYQQSQSKSLGGKQFRVMGPLHLKVANQKQLLEEENWIEFEAELKELRRTGVTAISTDIWWGLVEGEKPGRFDWSYYDRVVEVLARQGMHWVPILSFHQAGGNVNDDYMQAIPLWLWGRLLESHDELSRVQDLQYVSETGDASMEYVSLWADDYVLPYYQRFMEAFKQHYANHAGMMDEINVSLGPAGELRYPSYNAHDWGNYPNRGTLQCYSELAKRDWVNHLKRSFHTIGELNGHFGFTHERFEQAVMPDAEWIFSHKRYIHNAWAREFLNWYHHALVGHGRRIYKLALDVFNDEAMSAVAIGVKIPGIHWVVSSPEQPRAAEVTAGLIAVHPCLNSSNQNEYLNLLNGLLPEAESSRMAVHFTCLEMINKDYEGYSRAADLVDWMAQAASECQVSLMGENALAGELYNPQGWAQMARALNQSPGYDGLTLLRMQNFFDDEPTPMRELKKLINASA
ncbi:family 14 glycosylhydrolase [Aliagarivorans taiwanensis]|uniref:family 14 glycosylhydrolase n=1 Tax=Aliagarivorans taiwanensis TaxID=561966 RepID=UPI000A071230|nr:family 14 glycosylhydrolase [Aliagarivorans taiwanensis]